MKHLFLAALLIAPATAGADGERFIFEISGDISLAEPVATVRLLAQFDPRDYAFAGATLDIVAAESNWFNLRLPKPFFGTPGIPTRVGDRVELASMYQDNYWTAADPTNPILFWEASFEVFDYTPREIPIWTEAESFLVHTQAWSPGYVTRSTFTDGSAVIRVVPAPGSLCAIGLVVVAASRRPGR